MVSSLRTTQPNCLGSWPLGSHTLPKIKKKRHFYIADYSLSRREDLKHIAKIMNSCGHLQKTTKIFKNFFTFKDRFVYEKVAFGNQTESQVFIFFLTCSATVIFLLGSGSRPSNFIFTRRHTPTAYQLRSCTALKKKKEFK